MALPLLMGGTLLTIAADPASPLRSQIKTDLSRPAKPSGIVFSYADVAAPPAKSK